MKSKRLMGAMVGALASLMTAIAFAQAPTYYAPGNGIILTRCSDFCHDPALASKAASAFPNPALVSKAISDCCTCNAACDSSGSRNPKFASCVLTAIGNGGTSTCPPSSAPDVCTNAINIIASGGSTVTVSDVNQCCQFIYNTGTINASTLSQDCLNVPGTPPPPPAPPAPPAPTPPAPTTPSGSPAPQSACSCTPPADAMVGGKAIAFGPDKAPTPFLCTVGGGLSTSVPLTVTVSGQGKPIATDSSATLSADGMTMTLAPGSTKFTVNSNLTLSGYDASNALGTANVTVTDGTATQQCPIQVAISVEGHGAASSGGCSLIRK